MKDIDKAIEKALILILLLQDDPQLENYDNFRDCWNGALLKAHVEIRADREPYPLQDREKMAPVIDREAKASTAREIMHIAQRMYDVTGVKIVRFTMSWEEGPDSYPNYFRMKTERDEEDEKGEGNRRSGQAH